MKPALVVGACLTAVALFCPFIGAISQSPLSAQALVGRVLDTRTGALIAVTDDALLQSLFPCGAITLLGEVHDNPRHHEMRANLVRAAASTDRLASADCSSGTILGAFVFEHINAGQQMVLDRYEQERRHPLSPVNSEELFRLLEWDQSGWPSRAIFRPLIEEVMRRRSPVHAGNPARDATRRVAKEGVAGLPPERARQLGLDRPMEPELYKALLAELEAGHCGLMPKSALTNMALVQRYRDAHMAEATVEAANAHGSSVLFAGNGHVSGVAAELRRIAPGRVVVSVTLVEIEVGKADPQAFVPRDPAGKPASNFVIFTTAAERADPCIEMRRQMAK